jgi:hypothetical protein
MEEKILEYLRTHPCLSMRCVEQAAGIPTTTLSKALSKEKYRGLTQDHIEKVVPILKEYGFKLK